MTKHIILFTFVPQNRVYGLLELNEDTHDLVRHLEDLTDAAPYLLNGSNPWNINLFEELSQLTDLLEGWGRDSFYDQPSLSAYSKMEVPEDYAKGIVRSYNYRTLGAKFVPLESYLSVAITSKETREVSYSAGFPALTDLRMELGQAGFR